MYIYRMKVKSKIIRGVKKGVYILFTSIGTFQIVLSHPQCSSALTELKFYFVYAGVVGGPLKTFVNWEYEMERGIDRHLFGQEK